MADDVLASFMVALGFKVDTASQKAATKSVADYEKAVKDAEKRIEDAKWAAAQTDEEIAKLARETNLKLAREALEGAKAREKSELEQARKRKERAAEFVTGLSKMALAATAAATAIGYAVAKVAGSFDNLYFQAQRSGTSVQSLKALGYGFSQVGGTAQQAGAAVDSFTTKLRNNPGLRQFVKDLGVSDNLQGVDKFIATMDALRKQPKEIGVQYAEMLGVSEETFNLYLRQGEALKRYRDEYEATTKSLGVNSDDAAKAATAFQRTLTRLQATFSALGDKLLITLAPALERVVEQFQKFLSDNPEKVERVLRGISDAVVWLADKLRAMVEWFASDGGKRFMERWEEFSTRVAAIAHGFEAVWGILQKIDGWIESSTIWKFVKDWVALIGSGRFGLGGVIQDRLFGGGGGGGGPGGAPSGEGTDNRTWWQRHAPRWAGGKDAPGDQGGEGGAGIRARANRAGRFTSAPPEAEGTYRPVRRLTDRDLGDPVINTIAGEARLKTPGGADAVINNMFNRLGSKGWGPSGDLHDVARAPGQYEGYRRATPEEAKYIRERIKAIASGGVPDNTNGANSFRADWYRGPWYKKHGRFGKNVGGNIFSYDPSVKNGPYAPYSSPKTNTEGKVSLDRREKASIDDFLDNMEKNPAYQKERDDLNKRARDRSEGPRNGETFYDFYKRRVQNWMGTPEGEAVPRKLDGSGDTGFDGAKALTKELNEAWKKGREKGAIIDGKSYEEYLDAGVQARSKAQSEFTPSRELTLDEIRRFRAPDADGVRSLMRPAYPMGASPVNNSSSNDNRAVHQTIHNSVKVDGSQNPREHGRIIEASLGNAHRLAVANAQSAIA